MMNLSKLRKYIRLFSVVGKPTAGKSVKSKALAALGADFGIVQLTTSDVIRWNIQNETALGVEYAKHQEGMRMRKLVPCDLVLAGLADAIIRTHKPESCQVFIIDGSPRSEIQAKALVHCHVPFELFEIDISDDEAIRRTAERAKYQPRADDAKILEALENYRNETTPGIRLTRKAHLYTRIDGVQPMYSQLAQMLRKMNFTAHEFKKMMSSLDNPNHPARVIIDEAEGRRKRQEKPTYSPARRNFWEQPQLQGQAVAPA